jgi:hypothetical protein
MKSNGIPTRMLDSLFTDRPVLLYNLITFSIHFRKSIKCVRKLKPVEGIVSRDLQICILDQLMDLKFLAFGCMFFCFLNFVFVSNFLIFASWRIRFSELTL